jgi:hypothetical protein
LEVSVDVLDCCCCCCCEVGLVWLLTESTLTAFEFEKADRAADRDSGLIALHAAVGVAVSAALDGVVVLGAVDDDGDFSRSNC